MAPTTKPRIPLSRERVLEAAVALADEGGIDALSMRKLADQLGVKAMSLYNHVANKDDLLDGIVDAVWGEISLPDPAPSGRPRSANLRLDPRDAATPPVGRRPARRARAPVSPGCATATRCSAASGTPGSRRS